MAINEVMMDNDPIPVVPGEIYRGYCVSDHCCEYEAPVCRADGYRRRMYYAKVQKMQDTKAHVNSKCKDCGTELIWKKIKYAKKA